MQAELVLPPSPATTRTWLQPLLRPARIPAAVRKIASAAVVTANDTRPVPTPGIALHTVSGPPDRANPQIRFAPSHLTVAVSTVAFPGEWIPMPVCTAQGRRALLQNGRSFRPDSTSLEVCTTAAGYTAQTVFWRRRA